MRSRKFVLFVLLALIVGALPPAMAQEGDPILIGLEAPLTGDYAYEGQGFRDAIQLLVDQTNEAGGLLGRPVELVIEDDAGDPTQAALVADRLVSAGVVAVIGSYNSTATEAASEIYNEANLLHITPSSTATRLTEKGFGQFFRVCFLDNRQGLFAVSFMNEVLGATRIGILHDNSTYASGLAEWTQIYAEEAGLEVVFYDAINPDDQDFSPILSNIAEVAPDVVYFTGYHAQGGLLLRQTAELGFDITWMMGNASNNPELIEIAGLENAAGTYITTEPLPQDLEYPEAQVFIADFEELYGNPPASVWWQMAAEAYTVIAYAIEQTGSTDTDVLAEYLHTDFSDFPGLTGPIIGFDENGDRIGTIHVAYIIDEEGNFVLYPEQPASGTDDEMGMEGEMEEGEMEEATPAASS
ncbi:MAG: branched-chain amino acid ABC transporter substrate-binding protein [Anaerolineae bacterium]|nr:branched-chain amino acid ABC transporter substrate-binding protein [Anaerolineae bacterium]